MKSQTTLKSYLINEFDLSEKEAAIYLTLTKHGSSTVIELANKTNINRTTTHLNIQSLIQKGLITQVNKGRGSRRLIMAEPPEKLSLILKNKKNKIEAAEQQLFNITQQLENLKEVNSSGQEMEIRRYRGKDEVNLIFADVLKAKEIRTYANIEDILSIFPKSTERFLNAHRKNKDMLIWEIMKPSPAVERYAKKMAADRFFYCPIPDSLTLAPIDYILFDGKIAVIEMQDNTISGLVIANENFYNSSKVIYNFFWNALNSMTQNKK